MHWHTKMERVESATIDKHLVAAKVQMPSAAHEDQLRKQLNALVQFAQRGLSAQSGERGEVLIVRRGHVRGIWRCEGHQLAWTPSGYNEPLHRAESVEGALAYTVTAIMA